MTAKEALKRRTGACPYLLDPTRRPPAFPSLDDAIADFAPIELGDLGNAALLQRVTTKLAVPELLLAEALQTFENDYKVLEIDGCRCHRYQTQYFDTPNYGLYLQHHNGQRPRYKVRIRAYQDAAEAFLEVKRKSNQDITLKERLQVSDVATGIGAEGNAFLASTFPYPAESLHPTLWTQFRRTTLVSTQRAERVTLDMDLVLRLGRDEIALPGLAIAEVKRSDRALRSEFVARLRALGARPVSFSKYCFGVSLLVSRLKANRFKPQHMLLGRMIQEGERSWMNP